MSITDLPQDDDLTQIRQSVRRLCAAFPSELYQIAPISTNLILSYLAEHVLGLPRSY
jgi:hypothetical protein